MIQPPWQSTFLDSNNKVSQPWLQFFMSLYAASSGGGGGTGSSSDLGFTFEKSVDTEAIQTNLDQIMAMALNQASTEPGGGPRSLQYNQDGAFGGSPGLTFNNDNEIDLRGTKIQALDSDTITNTDGEFLMKGRDTGVGQLADKTSITAGADTYVGSTGASVVLKPGKKRIAGDAEFNAGGVDGDMATGGTGGDIKITAGTVTGISDPLDPDDLRYGGDVLIKTGSGSNRDGSFGVSIGANSAFKINEHRAFGIGSGTNYGQSGQVLTSNGSSDEPQWITIGTDYIRFDYGDLPTREIFLLTAEKTLVSVEIIIHEAFDDPTATASVGVTGSPEYLMATTDNSLTNTGSYLTEPGAMWNSDTGINLNLSAGSSTQGRGLVVLTYQRALP